MNKDSLIKLLTNQKYSKFINISSNTMYLTLLLIVFRYLAKDKSSKYAGCYHSIMKNKYSGNVKIIIEESILKISSLTDDIKEIFDAINYDHEDVFDAIDIVSSLESDEDFFILAVEMIRRIRSSRVRRNYSIYKFVSDLSNKEYRSVYAPFITDGLFQSFFNYKKIWGFSNAKENILFSFAVLLSTGIHYDNIKLGYEEDGFSYFSDNMRYEVAIAELVLNEMHGRKRLRNGILGRSSLTMATIMDILHLLEENGEGYILTPSGYLTRDKERDMRKNLIEENNVVDAIIDMGNISPLSGVNMCLWIIKKNRGRKDIFMGKYSYQNSNKLKELYFNRKSEKGVSKVIDVDDVIKYNLNPAVYIEDDYMVYDTDIAKLKLEIEKKEHLLDDIKKKIENRKGKLF